jgi:hypothetical protein
MNSESVFELKGKSLSWVFLYAFFSAILIGVSLLLFTLFFTDKIDSESLFASIVLISPVALFSLYILYRALLIKKVKIDKQYFYLIYGRKLINNIAFKDIEVIISGYRSVRFGTRSDFFSIRYNEKGKYSILDITDDIFSINDLIIIFKELVQCTTSYNIKINDQNHWLEKNIKPRI